MTVDLAEVRESLGAAREADLAVWEQTRKLLLEAVGESAFEIWLAQLQLIAIDHDDRLVSTRPRVRRDRGCASDLVD